MVENLQLAFIAVWEVRSALLTRYVASPRSRRYRSVRCDTITPAIYGQLLCTIRQIANSQTNRWSSHYLLLQKDGKINEVILKVISSGSKAAQASEPLILTNDWSIRRSFLLNGKLLRDRLYL